MNKIIVHNRVGIAIPTTEELVKHVFKTLDTEAQKLDPVAGPCVNPTVFLIYKLEDEEVIGICILYNQIVATQVQGGQVEFGIRIWDRQNWDKRYGPEATECTCLYAFGVMKVDRVVLKVLPENARAIRSYEKVGFIGVMHEVMDGYNFLWMEILRK